MASQRSKNTKRLGHPYSVATLRRQGGIAPGSPIFEFLERYATPSNTRFFDDFLGDAINLDYYAVANGGGAAVASYAITTASDGWIRATTGTANDATASASLITPVQWYGDQNAALEIRWRPITAVTETRIEMGFVDVVPSSNASIFNSLTTPSVNASVVDCAAYAYNHTGSTTTNILGTIGTSITAAKSTLTMPTAVAATTKNIIRIQMIANHVYIWVDGVPQTALNTGGTDYVEGGSALAIFSYVRANNATSKSHDMDYIEAVQERA